MKYFLIAAAVAGVSSAASAQLAVERYTYSYINPGAPGNFAGAGYVYNNTLNLDSNSGTVGYGLTIAAGAQGINFYGGGGTTISPASAPDFTALVPVTVTSPGGSGQFWGFDYFGGTNGYLSLGVLGGRNALLFSGGGSAIVEAGGRFLSSVVIAGDWSSLANRTAAAFNSNFNVLDNFSFDGTNTRFTVETSNYLLGQNPQISFALLGGGVPEPASWAMLIAGFGLVGAAARRRRVVSA